MTEWAVNNTRSRWEAYPPSGLRFPGQAFSTDQSRLQVRILSVWTVNRTRAAIGSPPVPIAGQNLKAARFRVGRDPGNLNK